jgi:rubrerythrin
MQDLEMCFRNFYKCPDCGTDWEDVWDSTCDDSCPACGARNISPYESEDYSED